MSKISVIIPVHDGGKRFRRCLEALGRSTRQPDEVIVVADGCRDASASAASAFGARVLTTDKAGGPARARNLGAKLATGGILIFLDADVAFHRDTIGCFESVLAEHEEVAAVIGNYDAAPPARSLLSRYKNLLQHFVHLEAPEEAFTFWGACGAIRRDVFEQVGGFDESYEVPSIEDIELGYRLRARGYRISHRREIQATHLKSWTARTLFASDVFRRAVPWTILIGERGGFHDGLNIGRHERIKVASVWAALALMPFGIISAWALIVGLALLLCALGLNARLFLFLYGKGGARLVVCGAMWHLFYHWYCGLGFVLGQVALIRRRYSGPLSHGFGAAQSCREEKSPSNDRT